MIRRAFTLMEIVLAIGLTSVVMYLLMTAVELYMLRVDSSRGRVESAQLALAPVVCDWEVFRNGFETP